MPFPLGEPGCSLFARARHGVWQGVQALGLQPDDEVLVPSYHHGSEIEALLRAGLRLRFYEAGETLAPNGDELDALLGPRVRALYVIHYLGFPQDVGLWRSWCDERGLLLLEDAAQAWLARDGDGAPVGSLGELSVFCLYKTFGLADGAALMVHARPPGPESARAHALAAVARRHARWLVGRPAILDGRARGRPSSGYDAAVDFALGDPGKPPSSTTSFLLSRIVDGNAAARRRANYAVLLDELSDRVAAPFDSLPAGASPFAFPLRVERKQDMLDRLRAAGVGALDFWSEAHPALPRERFGSTEERRRTTIGLPVHQELRGTDLERVLTAACGSRVRRPALRLELVDSPDALRNEWDELTTETDNVFATWDWNDLWWKHFGAGQQSVVTACIGRGGRVLGILPLYLFAARPLQILRFLGHGPADQLGPICAPRDRPAVARALRRVIEQTRPSVFVAEHLARGEEWGALLGGRVVRTEASPTLRFTGGTWDDYLATRSANVRQQVRRYERRLLEDHGLRYRFADGASGLAHDLETLFSLHRARWPTSDFVGRHGEFHRELAGRAAERGWLRIWFLEGDDGPVAAWYGFRLGAVESYYQAGRDPSWEGPPLGLVLLAHTIRAALEDGLAEYRFLRGAESFKYRFATDDEGLETIAVARGALATTALAASSALPEPLALSLRRRLAA